MGLRMVRLADHPAGVSLLSHPVEQRLRLHEPWVINPITQSEKFDTHGKFIRRYLPQLAALPDVDLHAPWQAGEIALHANGVKVLSVFESDKDAPFIAAQWRQVLRTTTVTPGLTAPKLLDRLLALQTTSVPALHQRIMDVDAKLTRQRTVIDEKESSINRLIYALYRLSTIDIRRIEQG